MDKYYTLTQSERDELNEQLAQGNISRSCKNSDWFNVRLESGRRVVGAYRHESEDGEFLRFEIK